MSGSPPVRRCWPRKKTSPGCATSSRKHGGTCRGERIEKTYVFDGPAGKKALSALFGSCSQLVVYHFMYDPSWDAGCKSCSFWADNFNGIPSHLRARDIAFAAISRAPLELLDA